MSSPDYQIFELGDVALQSGLTLRNAQLAYKTYGRLNAARSNVIVYPTSYGAQHYDTEWLIRPGRALDPERYFIIIPNMFGNGLSSSPSNVGPPHDRGRFPGVTVADNVRMQHRLLREQLGIERVALVYGWSMGGQQAYHWAALYPEMVERIAVVCGSARTAPHNHVFQHHAVHLRSQEAVQGFVRRVDDRFVLVEPGVEHHWHAGRFEEAWMSCQ